jgi:ribosomal protein L37AE/L43A
VVISCPVCGRKSIGKIGIGQYYCWDCCIEFAFDGTDYTAFNVEADGTLTLYTEPAEDIVNYE